MSHKLNLSKLEGEIAKAVQLRTDACATGNLDGYFKYAREVRHLKSIYERQRDLSVSIEDIRKYNDGAVI